MVMNLRSRVRLTHVFFYVHAALFVAVVLIGGEALRDWIVPVGATFALTSAELLRVKKQWSVEQGLPAEGFLGVSSLPNI
jgi:hypothetical protein